MAIRDIKEGLQYQGIEEERTHFLTVPTSWGVPTSTPTIKAYLLNETDLTYTDVTSTVLPTGAASISSQVITLPKLKALTEGGLYRIEIKFTIVANSDILEAYAWMRAER